MVPIKLLRCHVILPALAGRHYFQYGMGRPQVQVHENLMVRWTILTRDSSRNSPRDEYLNREGFQLSPYTSVCRSRNPTKVRPKVTSHESKFIIFGSMTEIEPQGHPGSNSGTWACRTVVRSPHFPRTPHSSLLASSSPPPRVPVGSARRSERLRSRLSATDSSTARRPRV